MTVYVALLRGVIAGKVRCGPWADLRVRAPVLKLHALALAVDSLRQRA